MKQPKIVFMGTPDFAVASLRAIHAVFPISAVVTTPDKAQGRGLHVHSSAVKIAAQELGIGTILQPERLKDEAFQRAMEELAPDIIVVVAFRILPASIYRLARLGAFNIHASLLPKFRGAAPINWAIMRGETETGVTSFLLADSVDTGAILDIKKIGIKAGMTAGELHDALMPLGAELAVETCKALAEKTVKPLPQLDSAATTAPKIFRETCRIDWTKNRKELLNFIHGLSPYPAAWTMLDGKVLKIFRAKQADGNGGNAGGFLLENGQFFAQCGDGMIEIQEVQAEGKKRMSAGDFLRGWRGVSEGNFA